MAEGGNEGVSIEGLDDNVVALAEQVKQLTSELQASAGNFVAAQASFSGVSVGALEKIADVMGVLPKSATMAAQNMNGLNMAVQSTSSKPMEIVTKSIDDIGGMTEGAGRAIMKMASQAGVGMKELQTVAESTGAMIGLETGRKILEKMDKTKLLTIQQSLMDFEKTALKAGQQFGQSFDEAQGSIGMFHQELANTMSTTKSTKDEVDKVRDALSKAFDAKQQVGQLQNLSKAQGEVRSTMNLTNTAILVGAAKGMDAAKVAGMMSNAYMNLGESQADVAKIFGEIGMAAEKSGLSFEKAADAIMASAESLKMWGGTIGSVTPLYKAFTGALGEGQKGLAVDLMNNFTKGLQTMGLETRALIGIQSGMGGGGGALGAGLEQEALMEQGEEGMAKMTEGLLETIKGFTGGEILTRDEARSTGKEQEFVMQRQLLKQMKIVSDDASGTKMLGILKEIDEHGLQTGSDAEKALGEIMQTGEKTQEATTGDLKKATIDVKLAVHTQGKNIVEALGKILERTGAQRVTRAIGRTATAAATGKVGLGTDMLKDFGKQMGGGTGESVEKFIGKMGKMLGIKTDTKEGAQAVQTGVGEAEDIIGTQIEKLVSTIESKTEAERTGKGEGFPLTEKAKEKLDTEGTLPMGVIRPLIQEMSKNIGSEIKPLKEKRDEGGGLDKTELSKLGVLQQKQQQVRGMLQQKGQFKTGAVGGDQASPAAGMVAREPRVKEILGSKITLPPKADADIAKAAVQKDKGGAQAGAAREAIQIVAAEPIPTIQVKEAQAATEEVQQRKEIALKVTSEPIEQEIKFSLKADKTTISIEIDEEEIKRVLRQEITEQE